MAADLWHFARGSELLRHRIALLGKSAAGLLLVLGLCISAGVCWEIHTSLDRSDHYLALMRMKAGVWNWLEFNPDKEIILENDNGRPVPLTMGTVAQHPNVVRAWVKTLSALTAGFALGGMIGTPLVTALWFWMRQFGRDTPADRHDRGAQLVTGRELERQLKDWNIAERRRAYRKTLGMLWLWKYLLSTSKSRDQAGLYRPYTLAGYPFPWGQETTHAMILGTTGTGKTTALRDLLYQARERGHRAVVFDLTGAYVEAFYDPERDILLNPLDERCPYWSIFHECNSREEFTAAAEALLPHDGGTSEPFWILAARLLCVETCLRLQQYGKATNEALADELMTTSLSQVHLLLKQTMADPLTAPEAARMAESIRAVFNVNAQALLSLPKAGDPFSIRRWIEDERDAGSIVFISARYADLSTVRSLLTLWMDTAIHTVTRLPISRTLRLWFVFDELGALHRLPALEKGLQTGRNFGAAFMLGIHAISKLRETYGDKLATTLASLARTKLILATSDYDTAKWCSEFLGHRQFKRMEEGYAYGASSIRDAVTLTPQTKVEALVMPDDIMNLPNLYGYIKFSQGFPAAPIKLRYRQYVLKAKAFIRRRAAPASPQHDLMQASSAGDFVSGDGGTDGGRGPVAANTRSARQTTGQHAAVSAGAMDETSRGPDKAEQEIPMEGPAGLPQETDALMDRSKPAMPETHTDWGPF